MAKENAKAAEGVQEKPATPNEPKYAVEKLRNASLELFGISTSTFDGATCGLSGEYTLDEMRRIIENWKKKEVK